VFSVHQDSTIFEGFDVGGAGRSSLLYTGRLGSNGGGLKRRLLISFDLSNPTLEGCSNVVAKVELQLEASRVKAVDRVGLRAHRMSKGWTSGTGSNEDADPGVSTAEAGESTWEYRVYPAEKWESIGGDFNPIPSATSTASCPSRFGCKRTLSSVAMAADVQTWLNDAKSNFGWILVGDEEELQTAQQFGSGNSRLVVSFDAANAFPSTTAEDGTTEQTTAARATSTAEAETTTALETTPPLEGTTAL